jgi:ATP-dependent helicase/nuclease subunit A
MSAPRIIPPELLKVQIEASDPAVSAWVAANAGSGKTHVLAQRVIRLLLDGVDPAKILCITFTKAASANMANRVFDTLAQWTALDDKSLDASIRTISNIRPDARVRAHARKLFATALDTPGGLKVQTIHALCTRLLHQFPFEANVAARFTVLDDAAEAQLLDRAVMTVLLDATREPDEALGRALAVAITSAADQTFKDVVAEAIRKRDLVSKWVARAGSVEAAVGDLCGLLAISPDETIEQVERQIVEGPLFPSAAWGGLAELCGEGSANDKEQGARLTAAVTGRGAEQVETYFKVFIDSKLSPRPSLLTKPLAKKYPDLAQRLAEEQARVLRLRDRRHAIACRNRTGALLTIADAVISRYRSEKDRRGLLDYDDLIDKTLALLGEERAAWVHYKLDQGIDHVLIDEAQDTSPKQWEIIRLLTAEFFAGAGARAVRRSIFAVGDEKQSIFSFQGAVPRTFAEMHDHFAREHKTGELPFIRREFKHSFRSGQNVLGAVDTVFSAQNVFRSVTSEAHGIPPHVALPEKAPGVVEIWDLVKADPKADMEAWDAPFDALSEKSPQLRLAAKIAQQVKRWTERGTRAGDVLVLVRQRGALFEAIIRALKEAQIAVAGADRLVLTEHIAVMDLMVLADALLLPEDDLALATVLKSPLFGLDDADLYAIAWGRKGSLRAALRAKTQTQPRFAEAVEKLDRYAQWAQHETPFAFYARLLGAERGRLKFFSRLGHEADDALGEFLNLALDYEQREVPSLQGFIAWLRTAKTDVKRDMEISRDEVRVMTVHGAKGLEAPVVILADTTTPPAGPVQRQPKLLPLPDADAPPDAPVRFMWAGLKATDFPAVTDAREVMRREAADEYRRLLYVGMTRAIDRLVVCGLQGERAIPDGCWYRLVRDTLEPLCVGELAEGGEETVWRFRKVPEPEDGPRASAAAPVAQIVLPSWLTHAAPDDGRTFQPLSPSRAYGETLPVRTGNGADRKKALARGELVHRLLQALPEIAPDGRAQAAGRFLAQATEFTADERDAIAAQVQTVLDDPRFAELFAPGSRAEVPIVGRVMIGGRTVPVSGQVDRLVVTPHAVLIADYKTNQPFPRKPEDTPQYVAQLALYRLVLTQLYPGRDIRAALVWTAGPELMPLSSAALDGALAGLSPLRETA